jgi:hypothetical protein
MYSTRYSCQNLMQVEFSRRICKKHSDIKCYENGIQWEPSCSMRMEGRTDGRTDRRTEVEKLIVTFVILPTRLKMEVVLSTQRLGKRCCLFFIF